MVTTTADLRALFASVYVPLWRAEMVDMSAWVVVRDEQGRWCVESRLPWPCRVCLTGVASWPDDRVEEHAYSLAAALNRVYDRTGEPIP